MSSSKVHSQKRRVVIIGAGVAGLTVAYELSKFPQFDISVYERHNVVGGLARSGRDAQGCATEYCWRVFFGFYKHLFEVMSEIPLADGKRTTMDNLVPYRNTSLSNKRLSLRDALLVFYQLAYGVTSCDPRLDKLDHKSWSEAMRGTSINHVLRSVGPWLGMDREKASYKSVIKVAIELNQMRLLFNREHDYITNQPTSEALFDPWEAHLKRRGVRFEFRHTFRGFANDHEAIFSVADGVTLTKMVYADYFVLALPIEVLCQVPIFDPRQQAKLAVLAKTCLHTQTAIQVYFDCPVSLGANHGCPNNSFLLVDAPWDLIVLQYDQAYDLNGATHLCDKRLVPNARGGWSIAVCTAYRPGILVKKAFTDCSPEEIHIELWAQITNSNKLDDLLRKHNDNLSLSELQQHIVHWSPVWPTFQYSGKDHKLRTNEPKFTNNAGSADLRPTADSPLPYNTYVATAYNAETIDIFSMEAACISGKLVASAITRKPLLSPLIGRGRLLAPFRAADLFCYSLGLPHILPLFLLCLLIVFAKTLFQSL